MILTPSHYIEPPTNDIKPLHGILNHLQMILTPPIILNHLQMILNPPWYIEPPTNDINPLPWYIEPHTRMVY